jgi:hypothetical protein
LPIVRIAAVDTPGEYKKAVLSLSELEEARRKALRLDPSLALDTLEEAEEFLQERGLLTRTADCALPSLFEACHEEPYRAGVGGFAEWPKTKWSWSFELTQRPGVYALKVHRGKTLYLGAQAARLADPVLRAELARMEAADEGWARLLRHLGDTGPSSPEDLQVELGLSPRELRWLRAPLERCGAIVTTAAGIARWDQVHPDAEEGEADLGALVVLGVRAAVVCPEREPERWFSWRWRWEDDLIERLVADGRLARPEPGWLCVA